MVADQTTNDGAVLLFDPRLVILPIRARPGELDSALDAVLHEQLVDELTPVVAVEPEQLKGQRWPQPFDRVHYQG